MGPGERARLGRTATRPRGAIGKTGQRLLESFHVGRGAHPTAPEAGALPGTGRYRATVQKPKSIHALV